MFRADRSYYWTCATCGVGVTIYWLVAEEVLNDRGEYHCPDCRSGDTRFKPCLSSTPYNIKPSLDVARETKGDTGE